ncbi:ribosome recycling factor [Amylibacter sp.]|nr:ribosome recycling factor [Amylibacter sp.]MDA9780538.1 ribosome recycling factor [Amylibacter sp.]
MSEDIDINAIEKRMNGAVLAMKSEFQALRTGRASASLLDKIMVNAYGAMTPLNQCAGINVPEPRMITVTVWDKTLIDSVDKAIRESNLGINPVGDGMMLRLPIPELNEERRIELTKVAGGYAESARIAVRNVRRDGMDQIKKSDELSEDDQKIWSDEIQELTNVSIKKIDEVLEQKQAEIMQV